jgi:hypothetical protein
MTEMSITVTFNLRMLHSYTDEHLATLWHVAQANPAPHGDPWAGEIAEKLGYEIIRRWLSKIEPEMYHHKAEDHYWEQLRRLAEYVPPEGADMYTDEVTWRRGTWRTKAVPGVLEDEEQQS